MCTTTSTTVTATETTTVTRTSSEGSTSMSYPATCQEYCTGSGNPWFIKCGWASCGSCVVCASAGQVPSPPPTPQIPTNIVIFTSTNQTSTTSLKAAAAAVQTTTTTTSSRRRTLITTSQESGQVVFGCVPQCLTSAALDWATKCTFAVCSTCPNCGSQTTTLTTITSTLTTTRNKSVNISSKASTTLRGSSTVQKLTTATKTTATRTSTTVTTNTGTTTSTVLPCEQVAPVIPSAACPDNMTSGDVCVTPAIENPCVVPGFFFFECLAPGVTKTQRREPWLTAGNYSLLCFVCEFNTSLDLDPHEKAMTLDLHWGGNVLAGIINESFILNYVVYRIDSCFRTIGEPLATIDRVSHDLAPNCCDPWAYTQRISFETEENSTRLMVVPNTTYGILYMGKVTEEIFDIKSAGLSSDAWRRGRSVLTTVVMAMIWCLGQGLGLKDWS